MEPAPQYPRFRPAGDTGLVVELGDGVSLSVNRQVRALDRRIAAAEIAGILETQPTNRSLFILYEPLAIAASELCRAVERLIADLPETPDESGCRAWIIPAIYGGEYGVDLALAAARLGMEPAALAARHAARTYSVFMIGFQPWFAYLGELDPALAVSRHGEPRPLVPAGTISIAG
ncbi:MAG: 5-oxoprolinase subunit B family protein, partial [Stellaceae bacterium]